MSTQLPAGPVKYVVLGGLLAVFAGVMWTLLDPVYFAFCFALLALEAWSLINSHAGDTISEVIWALNKRPVVPFAFGLGTAHLLTNLIPASPKGLWIAFLVGGLLGHFFFSRVCKEGE
jgi:hypothetical protein